MSKRGRKRKDRRKKSANHGKRPSANAQHYSKPGSLGHFDRRTGLLLCQTQIDVVS